jgi:hypothetical protein
MTMYKAEFVHVSVTPIAPCQGQIASTRDDITLPNLTIDMINAFLVC